MRAAPPGETSKQEVEPLPGELEEADSHQKKARKKAIAATEAAQRKGEGAFIPTNVAAGFKGIPHSLGVSSAGMVYLSRCPPHLVSP